MMSMRQFPSADAASPRRNRSAGHGKRVLFCFSGGRYASEGRRSGGGESGGLGSAATSGGEPCTRSPVTLGRGTVPAGGVGNAAGITAQSAALAHVPAWEVARSRLLEPCWGISSEHAPGEAERAV